jgi:hypothetical protein
MYGIFFYGSAQKIAMMGGKPLPFVLVNKKTSEIFTSMLINVYKIPYYGTKFWDQREDAETEIESFLLAQGIDDLAGWDIIEVEEMFLKLCNVKLNNDSRKRLFVNEQGKPIAKPVDS